MKTWTKILIGTGTAVVLLAILGFTIVESRRNVVTVQTGLVHRQDLVSIVTASGEVKPKQYVNIGANAFGKITKLYVKEGDKVQQGSPLAQIENVQPAADVAATKAELQAARTDALAAQAALRTNQADLNRAKADAERARLDYQRADALFENALIAKAEYDTKKAAWEVADAAVAQAQARVVQSRAQLDSANQHISQVSAKLTGATDVLSKTSYNAPFAGTVTNLPVREGETVVVGIQNSPGSTLMTLADMSVITAEVLVDETDIVSVRMGQPAEVSIDAVPRKIFKGVVTDIGDNAMVRSTGMATSQTTTGSQEAKDFKVVVTLQDPPPNLRPGLSCTAKITTATREQTLSMPIQALTVRQRKDLKDQDDPKSNQAPAPVIDKDRQEIQGVFVVRNHKAEFVPVETGITSTTDIEVLSGLREGDQIVTGSYKVLRTLRNGASVKIDNSTPKKEEGKS